MGHHAYFSHFSIVGAKNCRNKECSYLGFAVSRITCSIECAHHYLLITLSPCSLLSFLLLLNGFLSLSPPPPLALPLQRSLSPSRPLSFNTYKTERAQSGPGLGHLEAAKADSPHLSPPSMAPRQWPAVALYVALPILVNSNHWQLLQALFYGPPPLPPLSRCSSGPIVPGRPLFNAVLQVIKPWKSINHSSGAV